MTGMMSKVSVAFRTQGNARGMLNNCDFQMYNRTLTYILKISFN